MVNYKLIIYLVILGNLHLLLHHLHLSFPTLNINIHHHMLQIMHSHPLLFHALTILEILLDRCLLFLELFSLMAPNLMEYHLFLLFCIFLFGCLDLLKNENLNLRMIIFFFLILMNLILNPLLCGNTFLKKGLLLILKLGILVALTFFYFYLFFFFVNFILIL